MSDKDLTLPVKWLVMLPILTVFVGGIMWLTEMHETALQNRKQIHELKTEFKKNKAKVYEKINMQGERLGRIEGKLDMIIHMIKKGNK